jgi:hypothetical protein
MAAIVFELDNYKRELALTFLRSQIQFHVDSDFSTLIRVS